jgi:hypothetical protein
MEGLSVERLLELGIAELFCSTFEGNLIVKVYLISNSRVVKIGLRDVTSIRKAVNSLVPLFHCFVATRGPHTHIVIYTMNK